MAPGLAIGYSLDKRCADDLTAVSAAVQILKRQEKPERETERKAECVVEIHAFLPVEYLSRLGSMLSKFTILTPNNFWRPILVTFQQHYPRAQQLSVDCNSSRCFQCIT